MEVGQYRDNVVDHSCDCDSDNAVGLSINSQQMRANANAAVEAVAKNHPHFWWNAAFIDDMLIIESIKCGSLSAAVVDRSWRSRQPWQKEIANKEWCRHEEWGEMKCDGECTHHFSLMHAHARTSLLLFSAICSSWEDKHPTSTMLKRSGGSTLTLELPFGFNQRVDLNFKINVTIISPMYSLCVTYT